MRPVFSFFIAFLFLVDLPAQTYFSKEIWPMDFISKRGPMVLYEDTIILVGVGTDSFSYRRYNSFVAKYNLEGEFIERTTDLNGDYVSYYINNSFVVGDKIITGISSHERDGYRGGYLVVIDISSGKFDKKIKLTAPEDEQRIGIIVGVEQIDQENYIVISSINEKGKTISDTEICIVNIVTERVRKFELGTKDKNDIPSGHSWDGKHLLIGSAVFEKPFNILNPYQIRNAQSIIYKTDTSGVWDVVFLSDLHRGSVRNIYMTQDTSYICTAHKINYYNIPETDKYIWHNYFTVFKLNRNFELIWEKRWGLPHDVNYVFHASKIIRSNEKDGYILIGYCPNYEWTKNGTDPTYIPKEMRDSMKKAGTPPMLIGLMQKIDEQGDSVWLRSFSVVNDTSLYWLEHMIHDIVPAPDGGYFMNGDVAYPPIPGSDTANNYPAWLIRVDQYGCLVPGCHIGSDTTGTIQLSYPESLMLYPNPVSDVLYIYDDIGGECSYTVSDMSGRILSTWTGYLKDHTYILDTGGFSPGIYVIVRKSASGRIARGKFVRG